MTKPKSIEDLTKIVEAAVEQDEQARAFAAQEQETLKAQVAALQAKLDQEEEKRSAIERQLEVQVVQQTLGEIKSFADGLVEAGKLPPAQLANVVTLLSVAANLEGDVKSFALGDAGEAADKTVFALLTDTLDALPVNGQFRQGITKDAKAATRDRSGRTDVRRYANDPEASNALNELIRQKREANPKLSYIEAFREAQKEAIDAQ